MASSKGTPSTLNSVIKGTSHEAHRDLDSVSSSTTTDNNSSTGFRHQRQWPAAGGGTDDDFGRFVFGSESLTNTNASWQQSTSTLNNHLHQAHRGTAARDGEDIQALLNGSTSLTDQVYGDWHNELAEQQSRQHDQDSTMPQDPVVARTISRTEKGKTKLTRFDDDSDMSTEELELVSAVSSLDLADREYLKSLLARPESTAIVDYLRGNTYTDDVYGIPDKVQRVLDQAKAGTEQTDEGRSKALRRLAMVMRHLEH
ncbi:hypothetical protein OIO90_002395 [Microbotryomycetes sp. JL221]|nr:hypothetical protein OIO90_002395 [Microbotryomycetes sp. JL221]